jgi:hypothetical protein
VPVLRQASPYPGLGAPDDPHHLVICGMGSGSFGTLPKGTQGLDPQTRAVDKFTNWVEAKPLAKIGSKQVIDFIQDIIFHFGVPNSIITYNGTQFTGEKFLDFCDDNNISMNWAVVAHPRTNGQLERANGMILQGLKPHILT